MARALQLIDDIDLPGDIPIAQRDMALRFDQVFTSEPQIHVLQQRRRDHQVQSSPRSRDRLVSAAPIEAAIQIGQNSIPLIPTSAPMQTSAAQAGTKSEMNARDSPKASANTIGGAQTSFWRTKSMTWWV